ncbi:MAG: tRNA (adenosine(37)-N6)-dimethylallyltransferase MiaA, partial [Erysipelotrichaceae bacterium]|nr:tRNA (adenosine(37)-N6)-dimethylallyltransferase MiaA [Erysipelotrichaceae bacterium]
ARSCIEEISSRGKLPIICGGTGLYIKACLYDYHFIQDEQDHSDPYVELSNEQLHDLLKEKDQVSADKIHPNNRRRVLRALQLAEKEMNKSENEANQEHVMVYDALVIGCTTDREHLYERINRRVRMMVEDGLEEEIRGLLASGVTFEDHPMSGIGYKEWKPYMEGEGSVEDVIRAIQTHSRQFAKRQYTWFNHQIPTCWINRFEDPEGGFDVIEQWRK